MSATTDVPALEPSPPRFLAIGIIVLAAIKTWSGLTDLPAAFYDYGHTETKLIIAPGITTARLIITPLMGATALYLAFTRRIRAAISVLAAMILLNWLSELPSLYIHGLDLSATFGGMTELLAFFVYPQLAIAALWLAWRDRLIPVAASLVAIPTIVSGILLVGFGIEVALFGF